MAEDLLDRIRREISERKEAARTAYEESQRLEAALEALRTQSTDARSSHGGAMPSASSRGRTARAPRGQNRSRLLEALADRPGATAGQLAQVTGMPRTTAGTTLAKLAAEGVLGRVELPAGGVGFKVADPSATPTETAEQSDRVPADDMGADTAAETSADTAAEP